MLAQTPLFKSKGEAKRSVSQNGVAINNEKCADLEKKITKADLCSESSMIIRKGKKNYCVIEFKNS